MFTITAARSCKVTSEKRFAGGKGMSRADWASGAKRKVILKLETGVLEQNGTKRKGD